MKLSLKELQDIIEETDDVELKGQWVYLWTSTNKDDSDSDLFFKYAQDCIDQGVNVDMHKLFYAQELINIHQYDHPKVVQYCQDIIDNPESHLSFKALAYELITTTYLNQSNPNPTQAFNLYLEGLKKCPSASLYVGLGDLYLKGLGTPKDEEKAFLHYYLAKKEALNHPHFFTNHDVGLVQALFGLGKCYLYGYYVPKDLDKAHQYFEDIIYFGNYTSALPGWEKIMNI